MALPARINPFALAHGGESLSARVSIEGMSRIPELVPHAGASAEVRLRFYEGEDGRPRVDGELHATLQVRCQRCLEPTMIEVTREIRLMPVISDTDAARVDPDYEPLLVEEGSVSALELIEDELILSMPGYPCHRAGECRAPAGSPPPGRDEAPAPATHPFAVLRSLKRGDSGDEP